jgi:nucleotide-binding universal stress UspA family protein
MTIVCGVDFSDLAPAALRAAGALSACSHADVLYLVHVLDAQSLAQRSVAEQAEVRAEVGERLAAEARELSRRFELAHVHPTVLVGSPDAALTEFAEFNRASWLVVSSRGHADVPLYRLGGTSERVAAESRVPVLVVRENDPFEGWARRERPLRIVVGVDWTQSSDAAIDAVRSLRSCAPCDVVVVHVFDRREAAERYGLPLTDSSTESDPRIPELLSRDLARRVGDLGGSGEVLFKPTMGTAGIGDHLLDLADEERADLVVVGTHQRHDLQRLTSVSSVTLHHGRGAIACIPPSAAHPGAKRAAIRRVLVAADFSSRHVAEQAYAMAGNAGGEVQLVHVVDNASARENPAATDAELAARIRSLAPSWAVDQGVPTRVDIVRSRDLAQAIVEAAARLGSDVICVGAHAKAGVVRGHLGSMAKAIIEHSTLPVLVVRPLLP